MPRRPGPHSRAYLRGLLTGALAMLAVIALIDLGDRLLGDDPPQELTAEVGELIERFYFEPISAEELGQASARGMIRTLRDAHEDRFSHYFAPDDVEDLEAATSGEFSGVGLTVSEVPRGLRVASVIPDSPAEAAEIQEGEVITAVDGESLKGTPSDVATARIKGPPGTRVTLTVRAAGEERDVEIERASVRVPVVSGRMARAGGEPVAHVRLAGFTSGAHADLRREIERLEERGAEGLVLDLRGNGGGLLNEAVLTASVFVEEGETIASTRSRARGERTYEAVSGALEPRPTVVLVNRDTASAAEILAGALQAYDLAEIVGTRTFGKGTFQEIFDLDSGGALDLTVGEYLTAAGESLADEGLSPDVRAPARPGEDGDETLERGLELLAGELAPSG